MIDLARNFGRVAVAMGIEKASDAVALMPEERFIPLLRQRAGRNAAAAKQPA